MKRFRIFREIRIGAGFAAPYVKQWRVIEQADNLPPPVSGVEVAPETPLTSEWSSEPVPSGIEGSTE